MRAASAFIASVLLLAAAPARAANDSIVTLGLGTYTVVSRAASINPAGTSSTLGGQGFSARLRLLYFLGAELSYEATSAAAEQTNVPKPVYQLSALIYLYPGKKLSLYVVAGLGSTAITDIVKLGGTTTSYHGGVGAEVRITPHWMITGDGRINLPGYEQAMARVEPQALAAQGMSAIERYYNVHSWQVSIGIRYYL